MCLAGIVEVSRERKVVGDVRGQARALGEATRISFHTFGVLGKTNRLLPEDAKTLVILGDCISN
jgi:hypothetical protein